MAGASLYEIYEYLPKTSCGQCGMDCMGFAGHLLSRDVALDDCPALDEPQWVENKNCLREILGDGIKNELTGLIVDNTRCIGCGICVNVCPVHIASNREVAMGKGPRPNDITVIQIVDARVRLNHPELCNRAIPSAPPCKACADYCPTDAMELV
ncbi:MAG: 4Fe-4S dicluster domain-containing protein [Deltaproteobacteria bacterium]|nr:4Fe-4S dicluster domain-containing protein [Deltaproteobacteria bacterium]